MTKDKAAKLITNEINSRAKLNRADKYLKKKKEIEDITENKKYTLDQLKNVTRRILQIRFSRDMSGVDMDSYTRETMQDIIKDFLQKRPSYIEYINKIIKEEPKEKEFKRKQNKK